MKYIVGYQLLPDGQLVKSILENRKHIGEVYFSWDDLPNGRSVFTQRNDCLPFEAQARLMKDLKTFSEADLKLNLLLNGNCYGRLSQSRALFNKIGKAVEHIKENIGLHSVTTSSPLIARFIKNNFPELEIRASVNMEIGSIQGMDYISDNFDGYYMRRELNRDINAIINLKSWCDSNGKKLYMLANSGCLNNCSAHNFHDNLVAHEHEIQEMDNAFDFRGICHDYLRNPEKQLSIVRDTNFVRPEDIHLYEPHFSSIKLATRTNRNPMAVIESYIARKHLGNVTELLEPNHAESFYPFILENSKFPQDFAEKVMSCDKKCDKCDFCSKVFNQIKVNLEK
jgi:collagenase-like PrtC family protease